MDCKVLFSCFNIKLDELYPAIMIPALDAVLISKGVCSNLLILAGSCRLLL